MTSYYLLTFETTHDAMETKKALEQELALFVMPVLREITASCGIALRVENDQKETLLSALGRRRLPVGALYAVEQWPDQKPRIERQPLPEI